MSSYREAKLLINCLILQIKINFKIEVIGNNMFVMTAKFKIIKFNFTGVIKIQLLDSTEKIISLLKFDFSLEYAEKFLQERLTQTQVDLGTSD